MTGSLVEDMASAERLMREFYVSASYDPKARRPADNVKAAIAFTLSVLKDRLPADDRELVERLQEVVDDAGIRITDGQEKTILEAADRIIAYSASKGEMGAGERAGQTEELCRHGNGWNDNCEGCGRVWGSVLP